MLRAMFAPPAEEHAAEEALKAAWVVFDPLGHGRLSLREFAAAFSLLGGTVGEEDIAREFAKIDADGSGWIELKEFGLVLKRLATLAKGQPKQILHSGAAATAGSALVDEFKLLRLLDAETRRVVPLTHHARRRRRSNPQPSKPAPGACRSRLSGPPRIGAGLCRPRRRQHEDGGVHGGAGAHGAARRLQAARGGWRLGRAPLRAGASRVDHPGRHRLGPRAHPRGRRARGRRAAQQPLLGRGQGEHAPPRRAARRARAAPPGLQRGVDAQAA